MKTTVWNPLPCLLRERERVTSSGGFPLPAGRQVRRHKILFGVFVTVGILVYAAFNVWVYQYSKSGKAPSTAAGVLKGDSPPWRGVTFTGLGSNAGTPPPPPAVAIPTPTPTPRPTGPGEYACDPYGVCNKYGEDARRQFCTVTFADSLCLDQCADKTKQCKQ